MDLFIFPAFGIHYVVSFLIVVLYLTFAFAPLCLDCLNPIPTVRWWWRALRVGYGYERPLYVEVYDPFDPHDIDNKPDNWLDLPRGRCGGDGSWDNDEIQPYYEEDDPKIRCSLISYPCEIHCYPSQGGIIILSGMTAVDLDWLGLSRFSLSYRSDDQDEEDGFCLKLVQLGARWWKSRNFLARKQGAARTYGYNGYDEWGYTESYSSFFPPDIQISYPSKGGLWLLKYPIDSRVKTGGSQNLHYNLTMDERSEMLELMGATFHASIEECVEICASLENAVADGQQICEGLRTMRTTVYKENMRKRRRLQNVINLLDRKD